MTSKERALPEKSVRVAPSMKQIKKNTYIIEVKEGISAIHPIILKLKNHNVVICSIKTKNGKGKFDYSLLVSKSNIPLNSSAKKIIASLNHTENLKRRERGHKLAKKLGVKKETIENVKSLYGIK